jgi:transposase
MAAQAKKSGRPGKLTAAVQARIVDAVRAGSRREEAAAAAGIARSTLQGWLARGEAANAPARFQNFAAAVRQADAEWEVAAVEAIGSAAADGDWRALAWLLERRRPERWGRTTRLEHSGPEGGPIAVEDKLDLSKLDAAELASLQHLLERADGRDAT